MELFFAKTTILHIDPIFVCIKDETGADLGNFNCPLCKKNFPCPLQLERQIVNCQVKPSSISDIKPFITMTSNNICPILSDDEIADTLETTGSDIKPSVPFTPFVGTVHGVQLVVIDEDESQHPLELSDDEIPSHHVKGSLSPLSSDLEVENIQEISRQHNISYQGQRGYLYDFTTIRNV